MRILMLAQFYAPIVGGEERHVQDLSRELVKRGHQVAVVTLWHQGLAAFEIDRGVRVYRIRSMTQRAEWLFSDQRRHAPPFPDPEVVWAIHAIFRRERPDIVHAHNWLLHSFLPIKVWSRVPFVVTLHDYSLRCAQKRLMYQDVAPCSGPGPLKCLGCGASHYGPLKGQATVLANWVMGVAERPAVDLFLPVSQATAVGNALAEQGLPFEVIPNFVPDDLHAPDAGSGSEREFASHWAQLPQGEYLLFVGDLSEDKGVGVLVQAYAQLAEAPPLVLIGRRHSTTPATLPANVHVLGPWPHAAVMEAWRRSSMALAPSLTPETFGIVALEAMAAGRPVIAARSGGLSEVIVPGETGLLVPPGDVPALRAAMQQLIEDPHLRARMGMAAQRRSAAFRASAVVPRVEAVYERLSHRQKKVESEIVDIARQ